MNSGNRRAVDVWFPVFSQLLFPSVSYLLSWTRTSGHGWASDRSGPAFVWGLSHRRLQVIGSRGRPGSPQRCAWPTQTGMCVTSCLQEQGEECWECWCGSFLCWIAFFLGKSGRKAASGHFSVPVFQTIVSVLFLLVLVFILSDMRCQSKADLFYWSFNSLRCSRKMDRANPAGLFPYRKWRSLPGCCPQRNACAVRRMRQRVGVKFTTAALRVCSLNAPSASDWAELSLSRPLLQLYEGSVWFDCGGPRGRTTRKSDDGGEHGVTEQSDRRHSHAEGCSGTPRAPRGVWTRNAGSICCLFALTWPLTSALWLHVGRGPVLPTRLTLPSPHSIGNKNNQKMSLFETCRSN